MPILKVMTIRGPQSLKASLISGSPDGLAIVDKWNDGPYSMSVVAPLPGTDVYVHVSSPHDLDTPNFPRGQIAEKLANFIELLPTMCREYGNTATSPMPPLDVAIARYLGILTASQLESHAKLVQKSRAVSEAAREQETLIKTARDAQATQSLLVDFKRGAKITNEQFEMLLELTGIQVAPSTLGAIRKNLVSVQILDDGKRISTVGRRSKPTSTLTQLAYQLWSNG